MRGVTDWLLLWRIHSALASNQLTSSPGPKNFLPQLCATRLIPAVAFAVKTISRELRALMKVAAFALAPSYAVVACRTERHPYHQSLAAFLYKPVNKCITNTIPSTLSMVAQDALLP